MNSASRTTQLATSPAQFPVAWAVESLLGSDIIPVGMATLPAGTAIRREGIITLLERIIFITERIVSYPEGMVMLPARMASLPTGSTSVPPGNMTIPAGMNSIPVGNFRNILKFSYLLLCRHCRRGFRCRHRRGWRGRIAGAVLPHLAARSGFQSRLCSSGRSFSQPPPLGKRIIWPAHPRRLALIRSPLLIN